MTETVFTSIVGVIGMLVLLGLLIFFTVKLFHAKKTREWARGDAIRARQELEESEANFMKAREKLQFSLRRSVEHLSEMDRELLRSSMNALDEERDIVFSDIARIKEDENLNPDVEYSNQEYRDITRQCYQAIGILRKLTTEATRLDGLLNEGYHDVIHPPWHSKK